MPKKSEDGTRHAAVPRSLHTQELQIPRNCIGMLMGKGGQKIRDLQNTSGAKINVREDYGSKYVKIEGQTDDVNTAIDMITEMIAVRDKMNIEKITVPQICISKLIGKEGLTIQKIKDMSGASYIHIVPIADESQDKERVVEIGGKGETVVHVKELVEEFISQTLPMSYVLKKSKVGKAKAVHVPAASDLKTLEMHVPTTCVGAVIGQAGKKLRELKSITGAYIDVRGKQGDQFVMIQGRPSEVDRAMNLIKEIVRNQTEEPKYERIPVPEFCVVELLGKGGVTIRKMKEESGAFYFKLEGQEGESRFVGIKGAEESVMKGKSIVEEFLRVTTPKNLKTLEIPVPSNCVGSIIGKGGKKLSELRTITQACISLRDDQGHADQGNKILMLQGAPSDVNKVKTMIEEIVRNQTEEPLYERIPVPEFCVVELLGKGCITIRKMKEESGALYFNLEGKEGESRFVGIKGAEKSVTKGKLIVEEFLRVRTPNNLQTIEIPVPSYCAGSIIGKSGKKLLRLRTITGAYINLRDDQGQADQGNKIVLLQGAPSGVDKAKAMIEEIIINKTKENNKANRIVEKLPVPECCVEKLIGKRGSKILRRMASESGATHIRFNKVKKQK